VGDAFTDYVALDRPWVVVNLVAVPEFSLEPHRWCYPVLGCQAYRGYFSLEPARREQALFRNEGFDTFIGGVTAYSTLGWFDDPLHTGFTDLSEDRMVALMFHELAHRVVYLAGDTAFNESFATAVELEGLRLWLERQGNPEDFARALRRLEFRNRTLALVQETAGKLEQLYQRRDSLPVQTLRARKARQLSRLASAYEALARQYREPGPFGPAPVTLNNAHLALFRQYHQHVPAFRQLLRETGYDFEAFYRQVIRLSEQSPSARKARLSELSHRFDEHL
jgi:predicted aminopeptidase